jgi:hypothetical protein
LNRSELRILLSSILKGVVEAAVFDISGSLLNSADSVFKVAVDDEDDVDEGDDSFFNAHKDVREKFLIDGDDDDEVAESLSNSFDSIPLSTSADVEVSAPGAPDAPDAPDAPEAPLDFPLSETSSLMSF